MTAQVFNVEKYTFSDSENYLLDANIWMAIYGPLPPRDLRAKRYSAALKRLRLCGAVIFIDVLITSELVNRWARLAYDQVADPTRPFKTFRSSPQFVPVASDIAAATKAILRITKRTGTPFASTDMDAVLAAFAHGNHDFNDQLLAEKCRLDRMVLVSDDADMFQHDLKLVTGNQKVLAAS